MAASTTAKFFAPLAFRYSTRVSSRPALPTIERPNSNITSMPRTTGLASIRANTASSSARREGGVSSS